MKKRALPDVMLCHNNQRKMAGLPLLRKKDKRKRYYTRCAADEAVDSFLEYCNRGTEPVSASFETDEEPDYFPEEWDDGSSIGCGGCPEDECTGHCMSCAYRPI